MTGALYDTALVERLTGAKGSLDAAAGVFKVSVPRNDLAVQVGGVRMHRRLGLTSWAAFQQTGHGVMVMGDMVLQEAQVNPVMSVALDSGIVLACAFALGGCGTTVSAIHSPLYSPVRHTSTIEARATNTQMGIRRIVLAVTTGEMADCSVVDDILGQDSVIPCRRNANVVHFTCDFDGRPATATRTFSQDLGDRALVSYQAEAQPAVGRAVHSKAITYSGGFPFPEDLARPVLWHRAGSSTRPTFATAPASGSAAAGASRPASAET